MKFKRWPKKVLISVFRTTFGLFFIIIIIIIIIIRYPWDDDGMKLVKQTGAVDEKVNSLKLKPWYFEGGLLRPRPNEEDHLKLWPNEMKSDRILNQLMYIPKEQPESKKKIYFPRLHNLKFREAGSQIFHELNCPVKNCEIVSDPDIADAVIFENFIARIRNKTFINQIWILHSLESPLVSGKAIQQTSVNWTASYRRDSDLVTPYDKWVYYDENNQVSALKKNYAAGKSKKVVWFVSNCHSKNKRLEYAGVLKKYIPVDIFGECGDEICLKNFNNSCRDFISKNYKFYLSFENANCRDYITEKFYRNALRLDVIPIVMGPPREDYEKVAPYKSFIHVEDFSSPKKLAEYLLYLDSNDDDYNSYFLWKGAGEFINTYFMCRLCAMLHAPRSNHFYPKIDHWWRKPGICTKTFWNKTNRERVMKRVKKILLNLDQKWIR